MTSAVEDLLYRFLSEAMPKRLATKDSPLLSTAEVGQIIGRHPKTVLELVAEKKLGCIRQNATEVQFAQKHIDEYLASCECPAQDEHSQDDVERKPDRNPKYANR